MLMKELEWTLFTAQIQFVPLQSSILTGKFSHVNGFYKNVDGGDFNGEQLTFPKVFQKMVMKPVIGKCIWVLHPLVLIILKY